MTEVLQPTLADELADATNGVRRALRRAVREQVGSTLSRADTEVLVAVVDAPGIGVSDTARALGLAPNTVSTLVGRLVDAGLLERDVDPADRRVAVLRPTAAGRAHVRRWRSHREVLLTSALAELGEQDRRRIRDAIEPLRALTGVLRAEAEEAGPR